MSGPGPLGIVAGRGALPRLVAVAMEAAARPVEIVTLAPLPEPWIGRFPHRTIPFEALGAIFEHFSAAGIRDICLAGAMERPTLDPTRFDPTLAALAPRLLPLLREGDDALLRALIEVFEARGFRIVAAHEIVPELVIGAGTLTVHAPSKADCEDIARGRAILGALGPLDIGQGCVVAQGLCLGIETVQGTDAMLAFVAASDPRPDPAGPRGVFVKAPKPAQDRRVDLPTIGVETVRRVADAGLAGIAVEGGGVQILDRDETLAEAARAGLFIHGWAP